MYCHPTPKTIGNKFAVAIDEGGKTKKKNETTTSNFNFIKYLPVDFS